ncbi:MarR family winged helix-turn-helix transcriptional regulator [Quadrisphaera sp. DSM 44207]|uniref:MarR family winged helix-turn-helix transcriptional regulator n=1 Tax=Quadrisphaera sp. DSM 44207 TaxID=1881057 RepID=UPI000888D445|nr:MarR family transcriptional regulator [Quadrisphaera sp. DSM 44207]SDQ49236.1 DNA-binding transcriptional regulator, MarR family [Quadrisphaera sp. DSM 44207]
MSAGAPTPWLDEDEQRVWRAWLAAVRTVEEALERQLQQAAGMPHAYYRALVALSEAPGASLRMKDLAAVLGASQSRTSHAVARLEEAGWVARTADPSDRRGTSAVLTHEGLRVLQRAAPGHVEAVRQVLFDRLTPAQAAALGEVCDAVVRGAGAPGRAQGGSPRAAASRMLPR